MLGSSAPSPSWNVIHDVHQLLHYAFMRHAFVAGTIVAVIAGVVGYFVVLRQSSFAAHAMSEIGFAGASGGVAFGFSAVYGLLGMSLLGAGLIGLLGKRLRGRDAAIGSVLAFSLGLGSYFLTRYKGNASGAFSLLFGEILGISVRDVWVIAISGIVTLAVMAAVYRPLLFASLDEDVAEARGVPCTGALSSGSSSIVAVAVHRRGAGGRSAADLQSPGGPRSHRRALVPNARARAVALCVASSLVFVWSGLSITYYTKFPVGFLITALAFAVVHRRAPPRGRASAEPDHRRVPRHRRGGGAGAR